MIKHTPVGVIFLSARLWGLLHTTLTSPCNIQNFPHTIWYKIAYANPRSKQIKIAHVNGRSK